MKAFDYSLVKDPQYFCDNRMEAHSDHVYYRDGNEMQTAVQDGTETSFRYSLNGLWKFHYARNYKSAVQGFEKEDYCCYDWEDIHVPAHIQMEGYDAPQYANVQYPWEGHEEIYPGQIPERFNPVASYVKYFTVPEHMKGKRLFISFQGAESGLALWLNGAFVGYSEDSFTPSEFELTDYLKDGQNKLAAQVFKWTSSSWCEDQDFFRFSGIYREEEFWKNRQVSWIELQDVCGTNCYCDEEAIAEINKRTENYPTAGIHFIDSGNYHYMTRLWLTRMDQPFCLLVYDNHTDMQPPAFGGILSCGGWIAAALEELENLKYVILVVFVILLPMFLVDMVGQGAPYFCKLICPAGTLEGGLPLVLLNEGLRSAIGWLYAWKNLILVLTLLACIVIYRPFCKYICPLGAIYSLFNRVSVFRYRVDGEKCIHCGKCARACQMQVDPSKTPNHAECIRCGKCRSVCPTDAIQITTCFHKNQEETPGS